MNWSKNLRMQLIWQSAGEWLLPAPGNRTIAGIAGSAVWCRIGSCNGMNGLPGIVPILMLLVMGTTWGLQFVMLKLAIAGGYSEIAVLVMALFLISLGYGAELWRRKAFFTITAERVRFFVLTAAMGYLLPIGSTLLVAPALPAGLIVLIASLAPLFTFWISHAWKTEPISRTRALAGILGLVAVLFVLLPEARLPEGGISGWLVLALVIPVCYGVESVYISRRWPSGMNVLQVSFAEALMALLMVMPVFLLSGDFPGASEWVSAPGLAVLIFVLCSFLEIVLYFRLILMTGGVLVTFASFISLFAGIGWAILIFSETYSGKIWYAVAILAFSLLLVGLDNRRTSLTLHAESRGK